MRNALLWLATIVPAVIAYRYAKRHAWERLDAPRDEYRLKKYAEERAAAVAGITWLTAAFVLVYVLGF